MHRYVHEHPKVSNPATERLALEHAVVFYHRVDVLDARSRQLYPLVPSRFLGCQESPRLLLNRSEKVGARGEVSITNIHFPIELRVLVASVLKIWESYVVER